MTPPLEDDGVATPLAVGVIASTALVSTLLLGLGASLADAARLAHTADLAALAAADTVLGWRAGDPCQVAARIAQANGAALATCSVDTDSATVTVRRSILALPIERSARAGAPDRR